MSTHNKLRQWRHDNEVTLAELAQKAGLSLFQLHRIEARKTKRIDLRDALAIEAATGNQVEPRALLGE